MGKVNKIRTGIFSGAFDPVHHGHLVVANYMCEFEGIDEVWFTITPQSPSGKKTTAPVSERLDMVEKAIIDYDKFLVSDIETCLPQPNYTLNTLTILKANFPLRDFVLIMGADNWVKFPKWRGATQILEDFSVIIYPRNGYPVDEANLPQNVYYSKAPLIEYNSGFIRKAIQDRKDVRYFFPKEVWPYIQYYS